MKLLYTILAALLINDPVYCESEAKAPKPTDSSIELVDVSSVHGEYHLVLKVRNANPQSISVSITAIESEITSFSVVDAKTRKPWANFGATPMPPNPKEVIVQLPPGEELDFIVDLPPCELFGEEDFSKSIRFEHRILKSNSPAFHVSRVGGGKLSFRQLPAGAAPIK